MLPSRAFVRLDALAVKSDELDTVSLPSNCPSMRFGRRCLGELAGLAARVAAPIGR